MKNTELIEQAKKLIDNFRMCGSNSARFYALFIKAKEFLRVYAGPKSEFFTGLDRADPNWMEIAKKGPAAAEILEAYVSYVEDGLLTGITPERKAQLDVVSDILEQAIHLLEDSSVHPAVPAVIIGATVEEYLRSWIEAENLSLGNRKPSIDSYATTLKTAELITKQDVKDITSWAGLRNYAAHGEWDKIESRDYIRLVLEGVNLFMRKYNGEAAG